jgi:thioredoxin-related protein
MFNMKRISLAVLMAVVAVGLTSMRTPDPVKKTEDSVVKWLTFEEAIQKSKKEKKKFFIDVYTDWCGWCKVMDKNTFSDPAVAQMLNEKFYPVKFNAEQREDVTFNGTTFKYVESGRSGYHELAAALLNNQLSYPTVVFVDENFTSVSPLAGYKKAEEFHKYLMFFAEEHYKKGQNSWKEFEKDYKSPYQKAEVSGK